MQLKGPNVRLNRCQFYAASENKLPSKEHARLIVVGFSSQIYRAVVLGARTIFARSSHHPRSESFEVHQVTIIPTAKSIKFAQQTHRVCKTTFGIHIPSKMLKG